MRWRSGSARLLPLFLCNSSCVLESGGASEVVLEGLLKDCCSFNRNSLVSSGGAPGGCRPRSTQSPTSETPSRHQTIESASTAPAVHSRSPAEPSDWFKFIIPCRSQVYLTVKELVDKQCIPSDIKATGLGGQEVYKELLFERIR